MCTVTKYYSRTSHIMGRMTRLTIIDDGQSRDEIGHITH